MLFSPVFEVHPVKMDETGQSGWMDKSGSHELSTCHISETAILVLYMLREYDALCDMRTRIEIWCDLVFDDGYLLNFPQFYFIHPLSSSQGSMDKSG